MKRVFFLFAVMIFIFAFAGCAKRVSKTEKAAGIMEGVEGVEEGEKGMAEEVVEEPVSEEEMIARKVGEEVLDVKERARIKLAEEVEDVYFDFDRYEIRADARQTLAKNARVLKENKNVKALIEGHADERGTSEYNIALGERRASAVKRYLSDLGVEVRRIAIVSYGKEKPFCFESTEECWQENRRGHFVLSE